MPETGISIYTQMIRKSCDMIDALTAGMQCAQGEAAVQQEMLAEARMSELETLQNFTVELTKLIIDSDSEGSGQLHENNDSVFFAGELDDVEDEEYNVERP